jgi:TonB family protein
VWYAPHAAERDFTGLRLRGLPCSADDPLRSLVVTLLMIKTHSRARAALCASLIVCAHGQVRAHDDAVVAPELLAGQTLLPVYPADARGERARVVLDLDVSTEGRVSAVQVAEIEAPAERTDLFAEAARAHALALRFAPARHQQTVVPARIRVELRFEPPKPVTPIAIAPDHPPPTAPGPPPIPAPETAPAPAPASTPAPAPPPPATELQARASIATGAGAPRAAAASDFDIELGALRDVPRSSADQYLTLAPGVLLQNHSGTGHASSILLRGFDAGEGEDLEVTVDGIPINEPSNAHAHGYADTSFVIPEVVDSVRVIEGPFDARQGNFAVAGSAGYELGVRERGLRTRVEYGRFAERRGLLLWAPEDAARGTFVAVDARAGDGFGPNRAHDGFRALARYEQPRGELRYSLFGAAAAASHDSAGIIREDDYDARRLPCAGDADSQFYCLYDPNQGGSSSRGLLGAGLRWLRPGRELAFSGYLGQRELRARDDFTGFLLDDRGDGLEQRYSATTFGLLARYALSGRLWGQTQRFELGAFARRDVGRTRMWRVRREGAIPYETVFDTDLALTHGGGYVRGELAPLPWLALILGLRADVFAFSTLDLAAEESDRVGERLPVQGRDAFGSVLSPRASLRARIIDPLHWVVSAGTGLRSSDAQALSEGEDAPFARALAAETGPVLELGAAPGMRLEARAFGFATRVQDDLLFDPERGRNVPVGDSNRFGFGSSVRLRVSDTSDTLASFAWSEAHAVPDGSGFFDLSAGPLLPFVPRTTLRLDHASTARVQVMTESLRLRGVLGVAFVGPRPLPLGTESEAVFGVDVGLSVRVRMVELGASIENLLDARNRVAEFNHASQFDAPDGSGSLRAVRHFAAGPPRRWLLTLTLHFDESWIAGEPS